MAQRIRDHAWEATPLGPRADWPARLTLMVEHILASPLVSSLAWGPERLLIYNDAAARLYGARHPAALGRPLAESFLEGAGAVEPFYARAFAGETVTVEALPLDTRGEGGPTEQFDALLIPIRDDTGVVAGVHATSVEVSGGRQVQAALRESETRFRAFVNASSDVVYRMSPDWSQMRELDGRGFLADTPEPNPVWLDAYILPEDHAEVWAAIERAIRTRSMFDLEHRVRRVDGTVGWTRSRAVPILDAQGEIVEWLGAASDVTRRKEAEEALRDSEARLQQLVERQRVLLLELQHRVRNTLGVVRAMCWQTSRTSDTVEAFAQHLEGRLGALARTQIILTRSPGQGVDLQDIVREELLAHAARTPQVEVDGPDILLSAKAAEVLTLAVHELATNAVKYGALSEPQGRIRIGWTTSERDGVAWLRLVWEESGVRVIGAAPRRRGFGTELIERQVPYELRGRGELQLRPGGARCVVEFPLVPGDSILQTAAPEGPSAP